MSDRKLNSVYTKTYQQRYILGVMLIVVFTATAAVSYLLYSGRLVWVKKTRHGSSVVRVSGIDCSVEYAVVDGDGIITVVPDLSSRQWIFIFDENSVSAMSAHGDSSVAVDGEYYFSDVNGDGRPDLWGVYQGGYLGEIELLPKKWPEE